VSYQPDILVVSPDDYTVHLVVEAKLVSGKDEAAEMALKRTMMRMRAPTGILVTRDKISVFRESFTDYTEASIREVDGSIPTDKCPDLQPFATGFNRDPVAFEDAVQHWLDGLRYRLINGFTHGEDGNRLLVEHVLPALLQGEVRAAGPRSTIRAAG
jgi:hypothetical protein